MVANGLTGETIVRSSRVATQRGKTGTIATQREQQRCAVISVSDSATFFPGIEQLFPGHLYSNMFLGRNSFVTYT